MGRYILLITAVVLVSSLADTSAHAAYIRGDTQRVDTYVAGQYRSDPSSTAGDYFPYEGDEAQYARAVGLNFYRNPPSTQQYGVYDTRYYKPYSSESDSSGATLTKVSS